MRTKRDATTSGDLDILWSLTWSSSNTAVATVETDDGDITGISGGSATIYYTAVNGCGSNAGSGPVTIDPIITGLAISPTYPSGQFYQYYGYYNVICQSTPSGTYVASSISGGFAGGAWSSDDNTVATVNSSGVATPVSAGETGIRYTIPTTCASGTYAAYADITVDPSSVVPIIAGPATVIGPTTKTYSATPWVWGNFGTSYTWSVTGMAGLMSAYTYPGSSTAAIDVTFPGGGGGTTVTISCSYSDNCGIGVGSKSQNVTSY